MAQDYSSTARALAQPVSPPRSPSPNRQPLRTAWRRSRSNLSRGRSHSPYGNESMSYRDRAIDAAEKLYRRSIKAYESLTPLQRLITAAAIIISITITLLFLIFNEAIFAWLKPIAIKWKNTPGGWLIIFAITFATAFPPLIGYSTSVTFAGFVYGFPNGWFIVAAANITGSLCSFLLSRTLLSRFVQRLTANDPRWRAFSLVLKHDGLKILVMIRLCPLPYSISNGAMSTIETVSPLYFTLATALASPKLLIHVFIGSRMAVIAWDGGQLDTATKAINWIGIIGGMILGAVTGYLIYQRTVARSEQLEAEERGKVGAPRARGLSHPDEFVDDLGDGDADEEMGANDDIDFLDEDGRGGPYRDEDDEDGDDVFKYADGDEENSIGMDAQRTK